MQAIPSLGDEGIKFIVNGKFLEKLPSIRKLMPKISCRSVSVKQNKGSKNFDQEILKEKKGVIFWKNFFGMRDFRDGKGAELRRGEILEAAKI